jgi:hypothetical protein
MATQSQYEFFRLLYQEETDRYNELEQRARLYFTIISFYLGAIAFKFSDLSGFLRATHVPTAVVIFVAACMIISLTACVLGVQIRTYEGVAEPRDVIDSMGEQPPTDSEFFDARIADFAVATERNSRQNDRVAIYLSLSAIALAVAMVGQVVILVFLLIGG